MFEISKTFFEWPQIFRILMKSLQPHGFQLEVATIGLAYLLSCNVAL